MATLVRTKISKFGGGTYVDANTRAKVVVSRRMFVDGVAPETIEFTSESMAPPNPKYANRPIKADAGDKLEKAQARVVKAQERAAKLVEKVGKAQERADKLAAKLAEM